MQFSEDAIKRQITAIGYTPQDGKSGIYFKSYQNHDGYCIFVDFSSQKIIYDSDENPPGVAIKVWERTTSNFSQSENFVVLECVDSLLEKGYAPSCIELEKTYPSGHGRSGRLDMAQMQEIIDSKIDISHTSPRIKNLVQSWQGFTKFLWARDYVYGIDLDNRLVKTTKVSAFFNGDGEANIVWANGLDSFTKSEVFRGKLVGASGQDNGKFDILISNPPYSVDAFKSTIQDGEKSFDLYSSLTDNSSEIECLFVERMKQLLKVGGWAAVILPSSILSNSGLHARAREILLKYFNVKAIVELGSGAFMETGTNTAVFFLERRSNSDYEKIIHQVNRFFSTKNDTAAAGVENAFSTFVSAVYDGLTLADYLSIFSDAPTECAKEHELFRDYQKAFGEDFAEKAATLEKEKMLYFLLSYRQELVLVQAGKGKEQKRFLGYEFSKSRGREGLHWLTGRTQLYDEGDSYNPEKASSYIYQAYLNRRIPISAGLSNHIFYVPLYRMIEYGTDRFEKVIVPGKRQEPMYSKYPRRALGELCEIKIGGTPSRDIPEYFAGENLWVSVSELNGGVITDTKEKITEEAVRRSNVKRIPAGTTLLSFKLSLGKTAIAGRDLYTNEAIAALIPKGGDLLDRYLFYLFDGKWIDLDSLKGDNIFGKSLNVQHLKKGVRIPVPPLEVQQKIVAEMEQVEDKTQVISTRIAERYYAIEHSFDQISASHTELLSKLVECNPAKAEIPDDTLISFVEMAAVSNDGYIVGAVDRPMLEVRKGSYTYFQENDIIIAKITPCMENGKCALATGLTNGIGMGSSEFHVFRCGAEILPKYLFGYLNRQVIRQEAEKVMTGSSGHRRVPIRFYQQLLIPVPPLSDQQQIATKIQQAEDQIAQLNAQLRALKAEKDSILKKYL